MSDLGNNQCDNCEAILDNPADVICETCYLLETDDYKPCATCGFAISGCYDCKP